MREADREYQIIVRKIYHIGARNINRSKKCGTRISNQSGSSIC